MSDTQHSIPLAKELERLDRFQSVYPEIFVYGLPTPKGYEITVAIDERFDRFPDLVHACFLVVDELP